MTSSRREGIRQHLQAFEFERLFIEDLGWNHYHARGFAVIIDGLTFDLKPIAVKSGFAVFKCSPGEGGQIPAYEVRRKIERHVAKTVHEHLVLYVDEKATVQVWQWVRREVGRPTACREHTYRRGQTGEALVQRLQGLAFELAEEDKLTIVGVADRAKSTFDVERITKRFYDRFRDEHTAFLKLIAGISQEQDREWYASVMLNRLMFVYFIQRKGFLDADPSYLRNRLRRCQEAHGRDKFYSFYRYFLLKLFHEGLGSKERTPAVETLLGRIPYLNGGLFDIHELETPERYGSKIEIPDRAFERIFDYFDQYQWHLDEHPLRADNEINPDVLGYIFEKYINQKQMGAYYTKEDITEYISKYTILPYLLEEAQRGCAIAFENPHGPTVWDLLQEAPDRYIHSFIRHGADRALPKDVAVGVSSVGQRDTWNRPAPADYALPLETWRDVVARRERCGELRAALAGGLVKDVAELVRLNLDIRQFTQDVIENCEGPELLRAMWQAAEKVTILDPACGSGAFLFAALGILEPVYEACLNRMEAFVEEASQSGREARREGAMDFRAVLARVASHPNRRYFILKSIIINNLFGVDLMEEAVEICKLRLFLKLASQVEPDQSKLNVGIEPLPDIDFNVRPGNSLVGFATYESATRTVTSALDFDNTLERLSEKAEALQDTFDKFRRLQTEAEASVADGKADLQSRLRALEDELNRYLAAEYGVQSAQSAAYCKWVKSHEPFHWFIDFHGIIKRGGFDVIIANPPYVEYKDVRGSYEVRNYRTEGCGNLYAFFVERCGALGHEGSRTGMIIPLSAFSTDRMIPLIKELKQASAELEIANFSWRPGKLFEGANLQLSIFLQRLGKTEREVQTTQYLLWDSEARPALFSRIEFAAAGDARLAGSLPKLGVKPAASILEKLRSQKAELGSCVAKRSANKLFYRRGGLYWKVFVDFETGSSEEKVISLRPEVDKYAVIAALSSSLWFWYFQATSDCRHLGNRDIESFPFAPGTMKPQLLAELIKLGREYTKDLRKNAINATRVYKGKKAVECLSFRVNASKEIIDRIDEVLAKHYGFTDLERDFIINYDIKYRIGADGDDDD